MGHKQSQGALKIQNLFLFLKKIISYQQMNRRSLEVSRQKFGGLKSKREKYEDLSWTAMPKQNWNRANDNLRGKILLQMKHQGSGKMISIGKYMAKHWLISKHNISTQEDKRKLNRYACCHIRPSCAIFSNRSIFSVALHFGLVWSTCRIMLTLTTLLHCEVVKYTSALGCYCVNISSN